MDKELIQAGHVQCDLVHEFFSSRARSPLPLGSENCLSDPAPFPKRTFSRGPLPGLPGNHPLHQWHEEVDVGVRLPTSELGYGTTVSKLLTSQSSCLNMFPMMNTSSLKGS